MRLIGRYAWHAVSLQLNCGFCGSCPFHIPFNCFGGGLEISSQDHGRPAGDGPLPLAASSGQLSLHLTESAGVAQVPRWCGMEVGAHEGLHSEWLVGCQSFPWNLHEVEDSSPRRSSSFSGEGEEARTSKTISPRGWLNILCWKILQVSNDSLQFDRQLVWPC